MLASKQNERKSETKSHPASPREKGEEHAKECTLGINVPGLHNSFIFKQKEEDSVVRTPTKHSLFSYGSSPAHQRTLKTGFLSQAFLHPGLISGRT